MRILITGGAGFVGSHLSEHLLERGDEIFVLDDLSTGSIDNLEEARKHKKFHYTVDSVFNERLTAELVDRCDAVIHLAAAVGVMLIVESPVRTIETNIRGTEVILGLAAKKRKPVLIASTSEVYGKTTKTPFGEDDDSVLGPSSKGRWAYAASKLVDEFLALSYWKEKSLPTIVVRLFNTVGPRQTGRYGMVLPRFVEQGLRGGPITVFGDGKQSRCFGHVSDVVGALGKLIREKRAYGQVFNIGNDQEISIGNLAKMVRSKTNPKAKISFTPYNKAYEEGFEDMKRRVPNLSKIKKLIGYKPTFSTEKTVDSVIDYVRTHVISRG